MRLRYRAQALADIDAIHRFLEEHSPAGARKVLHAIYASIHLIAEHPLSYQRTMIRTSACLWCGASLQDFLRRDRRDG